MNLLLGLVKQAAAALPGFDIEILEMHHNKKVDAPSGTALMLGEAAARGRNLDLKTHSVRVRDGHTGPREEGSIGFATLRGGNVIGEHRVILAGPGERIELNHIADNRALFAALNEVRRDLGLPPLTPPAAMPVPGPGPGPGPQPDGGPGADVMTRFDQWQQQLAEIDQMPSPDHGFDWRSPMGFDLGSLAQGNFAIV